MQKEMPTAKPDQLQEFQHGDEIACYGAPVTEQIGWKKIRGRQHPQGVEPRIGGPGRLKSLPD